MLRTSLKSARSLSVAATLLLAGLTACRPDAATAPLVVEPSFAKGGGGPSVDAADPPAAPQDITLDVRVLGAGFDDGSVATWTIDGVAQPEVRTNSTRFVSRSELVANITIDATASIDLYDIEVLTTRGKKGIGADLFSVVKKGTPTFTMVELEPLAGFDDSYADAMNEAGQVVGSSAARQDATLTRWTIDSGLSKTAISLGSLPGWFAVTAKGLSDAGVAVGAFIPEEDGTLQRPVMWDADGSATLLSDGGTGRGNANDVSDFGGSWIAVGKVGNWQPAYWEGGGEPKILQPAEPGVSGEAHAVNSVGTIVGFSGQNAVVWVRSATPDANGSYYGAPCVLERDAHAYGVAEPGDGITHVAGSWNVTTERMGAVWSVDPSTCAVTTTRHLDEPSRMVDVSIDGDAVGDGRAQAVALLWTSAGDVFELPGVDRGGSGSERAMAITSDGRWIVGISRAPKRTRRGVLWVLQ